MANYDSLKSDIQRDIKQNGENAITGNLLQSSLLAMINSLGVAGFQFKGIATPATNPGTPDQNVFYIAAMPGTYSNFGSSIVDPGQLVIFTYNGSWSKNTMYDGALANAEYLLTLNMTGDNVFDKNYIRRNTIIGTSSPWNVFEYQDAYTTKYYKVPSTCNKIKVAGLVGASEKLWRLSKEPTDTSECIVGDATNAQFEIEINAGNREYGYFCVVLSRGSATPDFSNVQISFGDLRVDIEELKKFDKLVVGSTTPETISSFHVDGYIDWSTGVVQNSGYHSTDLIPVTLGTEITTQGFGGSSSIAFLAAYDKNGTYLQGNSRPGGGSGSFQYVVPDGVEFVRLSTIDSTIGVAEISILYASICLTPKDVATSVDDETKLIPNIGVLNQVRRELSIGVLYGKEVLTDVGNMLYIANGLPNQHAEFDSSVDYFPVTPGQIWKCQFCAEGYAAVCFYNANKEFINQYWQSSGAYAENFTVPVNAAFVRFCNRKTVVANPTFNIVAGYDDLTTLTTKINALQNADYGRPLVRLYPQTKLPVCSFQFDDIPAKDSELVALFESYKLTCAFAFIASESNITNRGAVYREYQRCGFQIMNHSVDGVVFDLNNYTYQTAMVAIMTALNRIQGAGMVCNGFVSPSSSMEQSFMPILKMAHAYAFTSSTASPTANGRNQDPCDLHRYSMQEHTLAEIEQYIDDSITNDQIMTFYGHAADLVDGDTSVFSLNKIAAIIEYCIAKRNAGQLYVGGTDDCVKYFFDL